MEKKKKREINNLIRKLKHLAPYLTSKHWEQIMRLESWRQPMLDDLGEFLHNYFDLDVDELCRLHPNLVETFLYEHGKNGRLPHYATTDREFLFSQFLSAIGMPEPDGSIQIPYSPQAMKRLLGSSCFYS